MLPFFMRASGRVYISVPALRVAALVRPRPMCSMFAISQERSFVYIRRFTRAFNIPDVLSASKVSVISTKKTTTSGSAIHNDQRGQFELFSCPDNSLYAKVAKPLKKIVPNPTNHGIPM